MFQEIICWTPFRNQPALLASFLLVTCTFQHPKYFFDAAFHIHETHNPLKTSTFQIRYGGLLNRAVSQTYVGKDLLVAKIP